ncbi:MAG: PD-(D/E)XK nuclease family protein [Candidatus Nanoarchaeia archaeon]
MILSSSMSHGVNYHFRIHQAKLDSLCTEFPELTNYLLAVRSNCPTHYFLEGPRSSSLKIHIPAEVKKVTHEVAYLARMGLDSDYYDNAHMNVQMFMLSFDNKTLAIEIPLWLTKDEFNDFEKLFCSNLALSGHIDLIRIEQGKIWIWDYKPKACKEKYATTQTYFYAIMLSKRTNIPLEKFMCGYFDDLDVYIFDPSKVVIESK